MLSPFIVQCMKEDALGILKAHDKELLETLWEAVNESFEIWKLNHGNRNPIIKPRGLLDGDRKISFEEAKPWECANFLNPSRISLTLKLLAENNEALAEVSKKFSTSQIFALIISREPSSYSNDDMFLAYQAMIKEQAKKQGSYAAILEYLPYIRAGETQKKNLAKGNAIAAKNKSKRAKDFDQLVIKLALETWKAHPYWGVEKVAEQVTNAAKNNGYKMSNGNFYKFNTIKQKIKGIKSSLKNQN